MQSTNNKMMTTGAAPSPQHPPPSSPPPPGGAAAAAVTPGGATTATTATTTMTTPPTTVGWTPSFSDRTRTPPSSSSSAVARRRAGRRSHPSDPNSEERRRRRRNGNGSSSSSSWRDALRDACLSRARAKRSTAVSRQRRHRLHPQQHQQQQQQWGGRDDNGDAIFNAAPVDSTRRKRDHDRHHLEEEEEMADMERRRIDAIEAATQAKTLVDEQLASMGVAVVTSSSSGGGLFASIDGECYDDAGGDGYDAGGDGRFYDVDENDAAEQHDEDMDREECRGDNNDDRILSEAEWHYLLTEVQDVLRYEEAERIKYAEEQYEYEEKALQDQIDSYHDHCCFDEYGGGDDYDEKDIAGDENEDPRVLCPVCKSGYLVTTSAGMLLCPNAAQPHSAPPPSSSSSAPPAASSTKKNAGARCNLRLDLGADGLSLSHLRHQLRLVIEEHAAVCPHGRLDFGVTDHHHHQPPAAMGGGVKTLSATCETCRADVIVL